MRDYKNTMGDVVASEMVNIMESEGYRAVFAKPELSKTAAAKKCKCPPDCKCVKNHKGEDECKCDKKDKGKDKKKEKKASTNDRFNLAVKSLSKLSEVLDDLGFVKSSVAAIKTLEQLVVEAEEMCSEDSSYSDDGKDRKLPEHESKSPIENAPKAEPKPKRPSNYKPQWERETFEISEADDGKDDSCSDDGKDRKLPEHESKSPIENAPKAEPKPKRPSNYKPQWERETFEISEADDAKERKLPEHESKSPIDNAPKAEPKPKRPSNYKPQWERETFEIDEASDGEVHGAYEAAIDVGIKDDTGMADDGAAADCMYDDDDAPAGEALRELLDALGLDASEDAEFSDEDFIASEEISEESDEGVEEDMEIAATAAAKSSKK